MNRQQVKEQLALFGARDREPLDPPTRAALAYAKADPDLSQWLGSNRAFHRQMAEHLEAIKVPVGLKERILDSAGAPRKTAPFPGPWVALLAIAASLVLLIALSPWRAFRTGNLFDAYRDRMARTVLRDYRMNMVSRNQAEIRRYLQQHSPHGTYQLTEPLNKAMGEGCALLSWQGKPVSLICLASGNGSDLFLFVIDRAAVANPPPAAPAFSQVSKLSTYSWSRADKVYILASKEPAAALAHWL